MFKTNFYSGEMAVTGQPEQYTSEAEAVQNASFGQYAAMQQYVPPTTYGLGGNVYQHNYGGYYGPPQQQYYPNPYMPNPTFGQPQQGWGNPVLQPGYQPIQQQQPTISQVYIPPVNISGNDYLLPSNIQEIAENMLMEYYNEEAEYQGKKVAENARLKRSYYNNPYYYNQNYYGAPMYGSMYNNFHSKVFDELENIKKDAKERRVNLSKQLSKLAHNCLNDGITDKQIDEMYDGRYVSVENTIYQWGEMDAFQARFTSDRFVPVDPGTPYREYVNETRKKIENVLPKDTSLEEFGSKMNILLSEWELEEMKERRRGFSDAYNSSTYKRLLKDRIAEREANKFGFSLFEDDSEPESITKIKNVINNLEATKSTNLTAEERTAAAKNLASSLGLTTLSDAIRIDEDGSICLSSNIGSHKGEPYEYSKI